MDETTGIELEVDAGDAAPGGARRRRVVTGTVAAMLVAGSGGLGFGLGRSVADGDAAPAAEPAVTSPPSVAPAGTETATLPPASAPVSTVIAEAMASTTAPAPAGGAISAEIVPGPFGGPHALVWEGMSDSGHRVRLLLGPTYDTDEYYGTFGDWRPEPFCSPGREMRLTIDGIDLVDVAVGSWFTDLYGDAEVAYVGDVGIPDGLPMRAAVVQAADGIAEVAVDWDDGVSLSAPVIDGVAVMVGGAGGAWEHPFSLRLVTGDGAESTVPGGYARHDDDPVWREACSPPPPALPEPGEQPADAAAARADIEARFALLWDQSIDRADKPVLLDDDTGVDDALAALGEGAFAETAATAVLTIEELVFTTPDHAWFRYTIDTDVSFFADRFGVARLTGDGWIFPRALVCQDLSLAGANCEPAFEQIYPPSWYEQFPSCAPGDGCPTYETSAIATW